MKKRFTHEQEIEISKQFEAGTTAIDLSRTHKCPSSHIYNIVSRIRRSRYALTQSIDRLPPPSTRYETLIKIIKEQKEVIADLAIENWKFKQQQQNANNFKL